jgi:actin-related protein
VGQDGDLFFHFFVKNKDVVSLNSIYLPFANSKKELTFERETESIIDNDNDMEALTIRQLYDRKIREDGDKLYKKELKRHQKTESRLQEEARMRQEEARMRQEKLAISVTKLHNQGFSPESIADVLLESLDIVQGIIERDPSV